MHRVLSLPLIALLALVPLATAVAQDVPAAALQPAATRIADRTILQDQSTYAAMQLRIRALNDRGSGAGPRVADYHLAKAQCWLDVSFHEYTRNDRSPFPQDALEQSERLIRLMEARATPLPDDTPLVNGATLLRPDLWALAQALRAAAGRHCAAQKLACAEVELVHAGNEHRQQDWRHAKPYVQIAEDQLIEARQAAQACPPLDAPPDVPPDAPPPRPAVPSPAPPSPPSADWEIVTRVLFAFDRDDAAHIATASRLQLDDLIERLRSGAWTLERITLVGHADRLNGTGRIDYNAQLALRRARTVRTLLLAAGVAADRFDLDAVGDTQSITDCRARGMTHAALLQCLEADRRVDILVRGMARR